MGWGMPNKTYFIDADSILNLLTHYSQGQVPLDAELKSAGVSALVHRWIGLLVTSKQWEGQNVLDSEWVKPIHIRYEGKKVLVFKPSEGADPVWVEPEEAPKLQSV